MNIDKVPVLGKIHRSLRSMITILVVLAITAIVLGALIPFYPEILYVLVSALFIVSGLSMIAMAFHLNQYKKKLHDLFTLKK